MAGLLEHGVRVLNYVGTWDWICNFIGNEAWVNALEWTGQEGFQKAEMRDWMVDGKAAGATKSHGGLTVGVSHRKLQLTNSSQRSKVPDTWFHTTNLSRLWLCSSAGSLPRTSDA